MFNYIDSDILSPAEKISYLIHDVKDVDWAVSAIMDEAEGDEALEILDGISVKIQSIVRDLEAAREKIE